MTRRLGVLFVGAALLTVAVTGCAEQADGAAETGSADVTTCVADAEQIDLSGDGFPEGWPFPEHTVVFHEEDRGDAGVIVTGVSSSPFEQVLDFMNGDVIDAGFVIESGETEEDDAEAEWEGNGYRGRWAIRESAQCPGETVIQVVAAQE